MSDLTRDEVLAAVHPINDATIAEIIATGVDHDELVQACRFYAKDRTARTPEDVPHGRVGRVVSILERAEAEVKESWLGEFGSTLQQRTVDRSLRRWCKRLAADLCSR